jgi:hypothetical protein
MEGVRNPDMMGSARELPVACRVEFPNLASASSELRFGELLLWLAVTQKPTHNICSGREVSFGAHVPAMYLSVASS